MKLVENKLNSFDWELRDYLLKNASGIENGITQSDLTFIMSVNKSSTIRKSLKKIKTYTDTKIGIKGRLVFIPRDFEELVIGMKYSVSKTLSHIESDIMQNPSLAEYYHAMIGDFYKKANKLPQGQLQMKFNGWERDSVDYYAKRYNKEMEK